MAAVEPHVGHVHRALEAQEHLLPRRLRAQPQRPPVPAEALPLVGGRPRGTGDQRLHACGVRHGHAIPSAVGQSGPLAARRVAQVKAPPRVQPGRSAGRRRILRPRLVTRRDHRGRSRGRHRLDEVSASHRLPAVVGSIVRGRAGSWDAPPASRLPNLRTCLRVHHCGGIPNGSYAVDESTPARTLLLRAPKRRCAMIRFGPAGFQYKDWEGIVYPLPKPKKFDQLAYIANYFDTVEINSTFYGPARATTVESWVRRVEHNPDFRFTAKLYQRFTHQRKTAWTKADVADVRAGFDPLMASGKLGAVLLQFPWSLPAHGREPRVAGRRGDHLRRLPAGAGGAALVVERAAVLRAAGRARRGLREHRPAALPRFDQAQRGGHQPRGLRARARPQLPATGSARTPAATPATTTSTPPTSWSRGPSAPGSWPGSPPPTTCSWSPTTTSAARRWPTR